MKRRFIVEVDWRGTLDPILILWITGHGTRVGLDSIFELCLVGKASLDKGGNRRNGTIHDG